MKAKIIVWILAFIFLISFVSAIGQITQISNTENSLTIIYPKNPSFVKGLPFVLHFHIINTSTNYEYQNNTPISCIIHIYNSTNNHIIESNLSLDSNNIDRYITINQSQIYNNIGIYPYLVFCNTSNPTINGYLSNSFIVSNENEQNNIIAILIGLGIVMLVLASIIFILGKEHFLLKLMLMIFIFTMILLVPKSIMYGTTSLEMFYISTIWLLRLFFIYIFIYFVYEILVYRGLLPDFNKK